MLRSNLDLQQPVFALSSGNLPSAIAIIRLSGPAIFDLIEPLLKISGSEKWTRRRGIWLADVFTVDGQKIDSALLLTFVNPNSYSGEDTIEFHCHGSVPIVEELQRQFVRLGARPAERGEFSYRALVNGKLTGSDLENLGDLYLAQTPADLRAIFSRRDGALQLQVEQLRDQLIRLQAILDTAVDFSDEYSSVVTMASQPLSQAIQGCSAIIQRYQSFRGGSAAPRLVLAGRPNAGKSSLFNALLGRYRAIVSETPGTTRDVIEEDIEIDSVRWKLVDTAGFRESREAIESEGVALGSQFLGVSSLWLLVIDGTLSLSSEEERLLHEFGHIPYLVVWNKVDLPSWRPADGGLVPAQRVVEVSAKTGLHLDKLAESISNVIRERIAVDLSSVLPTAVQSARLGHVLKELRDFRRRSARMSRRNIWENGIAGRFLCWRKWSARSMRTMFWIEFSANFVLASDRRHF